MYVHAVDPDPFTHVKKSDSGDDIDLSFLKELEAEEEIIKVKKHDKNKK